MKGPRIVIASNNDHVRLSVHEAITSHLKEIGSAEPLEVLMVPREYRPNDGFRGIVDDAHQAASAACATYGAQIGIAGAFGEVTLRRDRSRIARWNTFIVVASTPKSLVAGALGWNTYPPELTAGISETMANVIVSYATSTHDPPERTSDLAGAAIQGWAGMHFDDPRTRNEWVQ